MTPLPKNKRRGIDVCHSDSYAYIICSDKAEYFRIGDISNHSNVDRYPLSAACRYGDHYLACGSNAFYIVKGAEYRRASNMHQDTNPVVYTLHPNCQGGDFYLSAKTGYWSYSYYIIFLDRGVYRKVSNMNSDGGAVEYSLHPDCKDGLYYWGAKGNFCMMKEASTKWGFEFFQTDNMNKNSNQRRFAVHPEVVKLLVRSPGEAPSNEISPVASANSSLVTNFETSPVESTHSPEQMKSKNSPAKTAHSPEVSKKETLAVESSSPPGERKKKLSPVESFDSHVETNGKSSEDHQAEDENDLKKLR